MPTLNTSLPPIEAGIDPYVFYLQGPTADVHVRERPEAYGELPKADETLVLDPRFYGLGPVNYLETSLPAFSWLAPEDYFAETPETVFRSDQVTAEAVSLASRAVIEITDEQAQQLLRFQQQRGRGSRQQ